MLSKKPWQGEYVLMFIGAIFMSGFMAQVVMLMLHSAKVVGFRGENGFGILLLGTLGVQGVALALMPGLLKVHKLSLAEAFGLTRPGWWKSLLLAAGLLLLALPVILMMQNLCVNILTRLGHPPQSEKAVDLFLNATTPVARGYFIFFALVLAPVAEEFIFRGVLYPFIKQLGWPRTAFIGVNALFALFHLNLAALLPLFVLAMLLTWIYEQTDCLLASITAHSLFNTVNMVLLYFLPQLQDFMQRHHLPPPQ